MQNASIHSNIAETPPKTAPTITPTSGLEWAVNVEDDAEEDIAAAVVEVEDIVEFDTVAFVLATEI